MTFEEAMQSSGLEAALSPDQIVFSEANAILIARAAELEGVNPACLGITWRSEASPPFEIWSPPNTRNHPENYEQWDIGCCQISWHWWHRGIDNGSINADDLPDEDVFGHNINGKPRIFSGNPLSNVRAAARTLLAIHVKGIDPQTGVEYPSPDAERCCRYTGPDHRRRRLEIFNQLERPLTEFFNFYQGES